MADDKTEHFGNGDSFEERVLAQLAAIDSRLSSLEQKAEERSRDTRPLFEQAIKEMQQTRDEIGERLDHFAAELRAEMHMLGDRLDVIVIEVNKAQAGARGLERRLGDLEQKSA